jgi:hypothetical protein
MPEEFKKEALMHLKTPEAEFQATVRNGASHYKTLLKPNKSTSGSLSLRFSLYFYG